MVDGGAQSLWLESEGWAMVRLPAHYQGIPAPGEVRRVLRDGRAAVASHIVPPDGRHSANCWLYVCDDRTYSPAKLHETVRRHIRRAEAHLTFSWLDAAALLGHGYPAFRDTRRRNGLSDGTEADFRHRFASCFENPAHHVLGAWHDGALVAFMACTVVEDWIEIGGFSMDDDARIASQQRSGASRADALSCRARLPDGVVRAQLGSRQRRTGKGCIASS